MKRFVVVAYDIEDNKRRSQVAKLLEAVGLRVNKSVFECFLSDTKLEKLKVSITRRTVRGDVILYYRLCASCLEKIDRRGSGGLPKEVVVVI